MQAYVKRIEKEIKKLRGHYDRDYWKPKLERGEITKDEFAFITAPDEENIRLAQQHFINLYHKAKSGLIEARDLGRLPIIKILKNGFGTIDFELIGLNEQEGRAAFAAMNKFSRDGRLAKLTDFEEKAFRQFSFGVTINWMINIYWRFGLMDVKSVSDEDAQLM